MNSNIFMRCQIRGLFTACDYLFFSLAFILLVATTTFDSSRRPIFAGLLRARSGEKEVPV